jgi:DDE_Tnp_1-associated
VPDPRSAPGRWHPLEYILALAVCAFTAAGHDSPVAIAEWAAACSQATLAALGGRRDPWSGRVRPPGARTFSRVFARIDAEALNAAVHGYLDALDGVPAGPLPEVTAHEREQRRSAKARLPRPGCCPRRQRTARPCAAPSAPTAARCTCCRSSTSPPGARASPGMTRLGAPDVCCPLCQRGSGHTCGQLVETATMMWATVRPLVQLLCPRWARQRTSEMGKGCQKWEPTRRNSAMAAKAPSRRNGPSGK